MVQMTMTKLNKHFQLSVAMQNVNAFINVIHQTNYRDRVMEIFGYFHPLLFDQLPAIITLSIFFDQQ